MNKGNKIDPQLVEGLHTKGVEELKVVIFYGDKEGCRAFLKSRNAAIEAEIDMIKALVVRMPSVELYPIAEDASVEYISANTAVKTLMHIAGKVVGARLLNTMGLTGKGISVAVVDTGIYPHGDFTRPRNRIRVFKDFVNGRRTPYDDHGHGTYVSGILAGNGFSSRGLYRGVAPEAEIISVKAMNGDGGGETDHILRGLQWLYDSAEEYNIRVVTLAFGADVQKQEREDALVRAVNRLWEKGIVVVVAAGNSGPALHTINTPGISPKAITVGSTDDCRTVALEDDRIARFSSRGPVSGRCEKPDIVAPGVDIVSLATDRNDSRGKKGIRFPGHTSMSGTSVSTPIVAGICALILQNNSNLSPDQVKNILKKNAVHISYDHTSEGSGLVHIR